MIDSFSGLLQASLRLSGMTLILSTAAGLVATVLLAGRLKNYVTTAAAATLVCGVADTAFGFLRLQTRSMETLAGTAATLQSALGPAVFVFPAALAHAALMFPCAAAVAALILEQVPDKPLMDGAGPAKAPEDPRITLIVKTVAAGLLAAEPEPRTIEKLAAAGVQAAKAPAVYASVKAAFVRGAGPTPDGPPQDPLLAAAFRAGRDAARNADKKPGA